MATRLPRVSRTSFGLPVEPEVVRGAGRDLGAKTGDARSGNVQTIPALQKRTSFREAFRALRACGQQKSIRGEGRDEAIGGRPRFDQADRAPGFEAGEIDRRLIPRCAP